LNYRVSPEEGATTNEFLPNPSFNISVRDSMLEEGTIQ
jgi:hypothetical protein